MRGIAILAVAGAGVVGGCADGLDDRNLRSIVVEATSETTFSVTIDAFNYDGHELARCVAAAYANSLRNEEGERLHDVFVRDGGQISDEFRRRDGIRDKRSRGIQSYSFPDPEETGVGDHDGRDVMAVDLQLAECEKQDLPTTLEGN